jgi:hypothetical protein
VNHRQIKISYDKDEIALKEAQLEAVLDPPHAGTLKVIGGYLYTWSYGKWSKIPPLER